MNKARNIVIKSVIFILLLALSFYAGIQWKSQTLGCSEMYETTTPLEVQASSEQKGVIPTGTVLYKYYIPFADVDTFYMFINLKGQKALTIYKGEERFNLIVPLDATNQN